MVITTSSKSKFTMSVAAEVRDFFESFIKPLVTNESLEKLLGAFQEKIVKRFEEKLDEHNAKIVELQSKIATQDNALQRLEIKCDDNEQYSRRSCIRIHGVQYNENDDISVINKVEQCCDEIGVKFDMNEIDRVHYIGKPVFDAIPKQKVRSMIVKFKSWEIKFKSLIKRRWRNKLVFFYKTVNRLLPGYLYSYIDFPSQESYLLRSSLASIIRPLPTRTKSFKGTFFPYCINEWNKLKVGVRNAKSINIFKKSIVTEKKENSLFCIYDPLGVKLLTRLRLRFSHLNEHRFRHGFSDTINHMCACRTETETTEHFLLRCQFYSTQRLELFEKCEKVEPNFLNLNAKNQVLILLYGSQTISENLNQEILKNVIFYLKATARFDRPLIDF